MIGFLPNTLHGGSVGGGGVPFLGSPPPPPPFYKEGDNVMGVHANAPRCSLEHMAHIIYLRLTHGCMFKLLAMTFNRSFNMLNILLVII